MTGERPHAPDVSISMSLHLGDSMRETAHLSPAEMGAHMRLTMASWSHGGYLPAEPDRLRRLAGVDVDDWPSIWSVVQELWTVSDDARIYHQRTLEEIERARAKKASHQARGKLGGRPAKAQLKLEESSALAEGKANSKPNGNLSASRSARPDVSQDRGNPVSSEYSTAEESSALAEGKAGGKTPPPPPPPPPDLQKRGSGSPTVVVGDGSSTQHVVPAGKLRPSNAADLLWCLRIAMEQHRPELGMWSGGKFAQKDAREFLEGFGGKLDLDEIERRIELFAKNDDMKPWTMDKFVRCYNALGSTGGTGWSSRSKPGVSDAMKREFGLE